MGVKQIYADFVLPNTLNFKQNAIYLVRVNSMKRRPVILDLSGIVYKIRSGEVIMAMVIENAY